ncbi:unnamed protein product [Symbiodinium necroappetens]|uniref:Uncharacterized protein n=1 Tax=Symbiodinium necroappetens TaxID=1628268 RepID=A0A812N9K7_9DINO|nr:unnamed protein product [Symbiodinium necroappetens]
MFFDSAKNDYGKDADQRAPHYDTLKNAAIVSDDDLKRRVAETDRDTDRSWMATRPRVEEATGKKCSDSARYADQQKLPLPALGGEMLADLAKIPFKTDGVLKHSWGAEEKFNKSEANDSFDNKYFLCVHETVREVEKIFECSVQSTMDYEEKTRHDHYRLQPYVVHRGLRVGDGFPFYGAESISTYTPIQQRCLR